MRALLLATFFAMCSGVALAGPQCTSASKEKWLTEEAMKAKVTALGYTYKVFKVTDGNCYEIYGFNKSGQRVEVYFDPVTGQIHTENRS